MKTTLALSLSVAADAASITPMQKVIQMLQGMQEKGEKERHAEKLTYTKFEQWCGDTTREKEHSIEVMTQNYDKAIGAKETNEAQAEADSVKIEELSAELSTNEGEMDKATKQRKAEKKDYQLQLMDYDESVTAIGRAIKVLMARSEDVKQGEALAQLAKEAPRTAAHVQAFLQQAPEPNAYEFQSGGVVEMLKKLQAKFKAERVDLQKAEQKMNHDHQRFIQAKTDTIEGLKDTITARQTSLQKSNSQAADANRDAKISDTTRTEDSKYLAETKATCVKKAQEFEIRSKVRSDEIEAIGKAIEILSSKEASGNAEKHLRKETEAASLLQMKTLRPHGKEQQEIVAFLDAEAERLHSKKIALASVRASETGVFDKIRGMIQKLLDELKSEAASEMKEKQWCDKEMSLNQIDLKELAAQSDRANNEKEKQESKIAKMTTRKKELTEGINSINQARNTASQLRSEEAATATETIADAKAGEKAVASAIAVLKDFYEGAAESTALVQAQQPGPATWDTPYTGMGGSEGILGMLEVCQADFTRLAVTTQQEEAAAKEEFEKFSNESETDLAVKKTSLTNTIRALATANNANTKAIEELDSLGKQVEAATEKKNNLHEKCVDTGMSYEERVASREAEIASLKEAVKLLEKSD